MKKITFALMLAAVFASTTAFAADEVKPAAQTFEYKYKTPKLNKAQIDALLAKPADVLFIDLRRPDELTKIGGLPVYLSIQTDDLEKSLAYIPKDRNVATISNHAGRAGKAGDFLSTKGFKVVGAIGVQNYEEDGGKLTKIAIPPPRATAPAQK
ncbi:MAG: rhodanese-like domain-containing protein [Methylophilaceae bacterium]|nr:rhodanese-like domain-containing protein [Methylophilaceae bacterium]